MLLVESKWGKCDRAEVTTYSRTKSEQSDGLDFSPFLPGTASRAFRVTLPFWASVFPSFYLISNYTNLIVSSGSPNWKMAGHMVRVSSLLVPFTKWLKVKKCLTVNRKAYVVQDLCPSQLVFHVKRPLLY